MRTLRQLLPALVLGCGLLAGCATPRPIKTIHIDPLTIHIGEVDDITAIRTKLTGDPTRVNGFCLAAQHTIYVKYGWGDDPDAETLLHELKHLLEWDGTRWHKWRWAEEGQAVEIE